jgi:hypothetical protein
MSAANASLRDEPGTSPRQLDQPPEEPGAPLFETALLPDLFWVSKKIFARKNGGPPDMEYRAGRLVCVAGLSHQHPMPFEPRVVPGIMVLPFEVRCRREAIGLPLGGRLIAL